MLLLYPKTGVDLGSTVAPPHSLLSIAAPVVREGYKVKIIDQRVEPVTAEIIRSYLSSDLLCVGVSCMTGTQIFHALRLTGWVRGLTNGKVPIVWGGPHPTILPEQTLCHKNVDIVVVGEGDESFLELVRALDHKRSLTDVKGIAYKDGTAQVNTGERPLMDVEKLLPTPWELVDVEKYVQRDMYVKRRRRVLDLGQTSRGCPYQCGFCCSAAIRKRRWRPMSVEKSLHLIVDNVRRFKLDGFWLRDDEFYIDRKRAHEICLGMIRENLDVSFYTSGTRVDVFLRANDEQLEVLKRAGAHTLKFGVESGSQRILDLMQKGSRVEQALEASLRCKQFGFTFAFSLLVGYPTETFEDVNKTIDIAFQLMRENPGAQLEAIGTYTALPATPSYDLALEHGLVPPQTLDGWNNWLFDDYDLEGHKLPWYNRKQRIALGNITYMSVLSNALTNAIGSLRNPAIRWPAALLSKAISQYYAGRLKKKKYCFAPELRLVQKLRRSLFYRTDITLR